MMVLRLMRDEGGGVLEGGDKSSKKCFIFLTDMTVEEDRSDDEAEVGRCNPPRDGGKWTSAASLPLPVAMNVATTKLWFDR
ncbi:hypothetical protein ZWY2020_020644 [Hordeum vulgare]|nr:hypothetical protein ZWY2020_020644 [Hordeum vulgare]